MTIPSGGGTVALWSLKLATLFAHDRHRIEIWRRLEDGWGREAVEPGGAAELKSIGCRLEVESLYRD